MAGDEVVHDHWGGGVVVSAKGEGSRAQATVRFDSVGKKEPAAFGDTAPKGLSTHRRTGRPGRPGGRTGSGTGTVQRSGRARSAAGT